MLMLKLTPLSPRRREIVFRLDSPRWSFMPHHNFFPWSSLPRAEEYELNGIKFPDTNMQRPLSKRSWDELLKTTCWLSSEPSERNLTSRRGKHSFKSVGTGGP